MQGSIAFGHLSEEFSQQPESELSPLGQARTIQEAKRKSQNAKVALPFDPALRDDLPFDLLFRRFRRRLTGAVEGERMPVRRDRVPRGWGLGAGGWGLGLRGGEPAMDRSFKNDRIARRFHNAFSVFSLPFEL